MITIQHASDLHLEFTRKKPITLEKTNSDVIALAGDIHTKRRGMLVAFQTSVEHKKPVVYVPGNHDLWGCTWSTFEEKMKLLHQELQAKYPYATVYYLERSSCTINGVRILGATLWPAMSSLPFPSAEEEKETSMDRSAVYDLVKSKSNDYKKIKNSTNGKYCKLTPLHVRARHVATREWLQQQLTEDKTTPTIIVTHHPPSFEFVPDKSSNRLIDGSDLTPLILSSSNLLAWIHGHTHHPHTSTIGTCIVTSNPFGYPDQNIPFDPSACLTLPCPHDFTC
jgi:Icc-related predicted phosphoesterase